MGNCVETCLQRENTEELRIEEEKTGEFVKENIEMEKGKTNMRLKVVLTREELEWLLLQLKFREGENLEQVLGEIERNRGKISSGWKPSLESIIESPEVPENMDRWLFGVINLDLRYVRPVDGEVLAIVRRTVFRL